MKRRKKISTWYVIAVGMTILCMYVASQFLTLGKTTVKKSSPPLLFELVYPPYYKDPNSTENEIVAAQAELTRLGFYDGEIDGDAGEKTMTAEVKYLDALRRGEKFSDIYGRQ